MPLFVSDPFLAEFRAADFQGQRAMQPPVPLQATARHTANLLCSSWKPAELKDRQMLHRPERDLGL